MLKIMRVMWMILQADKAEDWVISTIVSKSARQMVIKAFEYVGVELEVHGKDKAKRHLSKLVAARPIN